LQAYDFSKVALITGIIRNLDGFIITIHCLDSHEHFFDITLPNVKEVGRTLDFLWKAYKPLKKMICFNLKTAYSVLVFNPGWQRHISGIVKGRIQGPNQGKLSRNEFEIYDTDKPIWVVIWLTKG
jgi:hypothetical protein